MSSGCRTDAGIEYMNKRLSYVESKRGFVWHTRMPNIYEAIAMAIIDVWTFHVPFLDIGCREFEVR